MVEVAGAPVFEQEELDWETYGLYGLVDESMTYDGLVCRSDSPSGSGPSRSRWRAG